MTEQTVPDRAQVARWLNRAGVEFYQCEQCHGLHLPRLQALDGAADAGLYVEDFGLVLSVELVVRPVGMLPLMADLGRLSMDYPLLKLFQDVVDDGMPQLVIGACLLTGAGLSFEQFQLFLQTAMESSQQLAAECRHLDYLYLVDAQGDRLPHAPVH